MITTTHALDDPTRGNLTTCPPILVRIEPNVPRRWMHCNARNRADCSRKGPDVKVETDAV